MHSVEKAEVQKFLETEIPEIDAERIRIIEWRPSMNYYKESYVKLLSAAVEFIKRADAENRTAAVFGKRWVRNFFKNLNLLNQTLLYKQTDIPVIVTGSGPSLEQAVPVIKETQDNCLIIAASSSVTALSCGGVTPDIIIATDGGNWALRHIYPNYRNAAHSPIPLAVNLTAALPSQCAATPQLIINDGSFWQSIVLHELGLPSVIIPQKGTVTAAALELALILSQTNIYLAGMDLSVSDIRTHARPYSFDSLLSDRACRFTPFYSESFTRSTLLREGGSMGIYRSWFKNQIETWPKRIFSITDSEIFKNGIPSGEAVAKKRDNFNTVCVEGEPSIFCKRGASALLAAIKKQNYSGILKKELTPLLFPGENKVTEKELEMAIKETAVKEAL